MGPDACLTHQTGLVTLTCHLSTSKITNTPLNIRSSAQRVTYSRFCQLLDFLDFCIGDDVEVANDVGAVPLVLLFDRRQHKPGVTIVVVVSTEQPALSARGLVVRLRIKPEWKIKVRRRLIISAAFLPHHLEAFPSTKHLILLPLWDQRERVTLLLFLVLFARDPLSTLLLRPSRFLGGFFLLVQLELEVLHVALCTLVLRV